MAELIARTWSLGVLRVALEVDGTTPEVVCSLVVTRDGRRVTADQQRFELREFGNFDSESGSRMRELVTRIPDALVGKVSDWMSAASREQPILWVWLVKPYGPLGAVPWEQLWNAAGTPVLRLPDVLPDSRPPLRTINVAICASGPMVKGPSPVVDTVPDVVEAISTTGHPARFHLFVDSASRPALQHALGGYGGGLEIHEWFPDTASAPERPTRSGRRPAQPMNPWLDWMVRSVRKQSFDFVNFVGHGYLLGDEGRLAMSRDPDHHEAVSHISAGQLLEFLPKVGAYGAVFTSAENNYSASGLRLLADAIGSRRAGPVMLHDASQGPFELSYGYRVMLGEENVVGASAPTSLMMYVQPEVVLSRKSQEEAQTGEYGVSFIDEDEGGPDSTVPELASPSETLRQIEDTAAGGELPPWAAAMSRFIEQKEVELRTYLRDTGKAADEAYVRGQQQALDQLSKLTEQHLGMS